MKNGTEVLHASGKERSDDAGKGIVGKPSETDAERSGGKKGEETMVYVGGHFEQESAGLVDGVSARMTLNVDDSEPTYDYTVDSFTGNAPERKVGRVNNESVKGKGKSFDMGEF